MALDPVSLVNDALMRIGEDPIQSFQDNTANSNAANICFPQSRLFLLSGYPWSFAATWAQLAQISQPVVPGQHYLYQYQLPTTCLHLNSVWYGGTNTPSSSVIGGAPNPYVANLSSVVNVIQFNEEASEWESVGNTILANYPFLGAWFNVDQPDTSIWTSQFAEMMIAHLAWKLAYARAKSSSLQQSMEATYLRVAQTARHTDSTNKPSKPLGMRGYSNTLGIRRY